MSCKDQAFKLSPLLSKFVHENDGEMDELALLQNFRKSTQKKKFRHNCLDLPYHMRMCLETGGFERRYHMSCKAYLQLVDILNINVDIQKSMNSTSGNASIIPAMVDMGIRFYGGEKIKSIADLFRVGIVSAQRVIDVFIDATESSNHPFLSTDLLPEPHSDRRRVADEWGEQSGVYGLYYGYLAVIDGWMCTIEQPSDVDNPVDFFSGHYQRFGLNVQAMCDTNLHITYILVAGNGGTSNAQTFRKLHKLRDWLLRLPDGFFILGDNAYGLTSKLLIPFSGASEQDTFNDTYNFFLSQLHIRVEMAFGRLSTKWRIFRSNLLAVNGIQQKIQIVRVGAKLHNYVINADRLNFLDIFEDDIESFGVERLGKVSFANNGYYSVVDASEHTITSTRVDGSDDDRRQKNCRRYR